MARITETQIELLTIQRLKSLGYKYLYGVDIAPDGHFLKGDIISPVLLFKM